MTEPSKEAVEIVARQCYVRRFQRPWEQAGPVMREVALNSATYDLRAALPIERERWEKEVRERTFQLREEMREAAEDASVYADLDPEYVQSMVDAAVERLLDGIFEKGEGGQ